MADWEWPSIEDKLEAIGYLAVPGVLEKIEPQVPIGDKEKFREEYSNKFSKEYPYEANKFGYQFRIYLNDPEGCPEFLKDYLDATYGKRINNTSFIDELVKEYGFKFTKEQQDYKTIMELVRQKHGEKLLGAFYKGFNVYGDFVQNIEDHVKSEDNLTRPNILEYEEKTITRRTRQINSSTDRTTGFTSEQMLKLGWIGEEYIAYLLENKDEILLDALGISSEEQYNIEWFNEGALDAEEWEDKSVGKGCDIIVKVETGNDFYIEVKTSKRSYSFFNMTSVEMQEMEKRREQYFVIKVNNIERLLRNESPDIITIIDPFEKLFAPRHMKEATFIIGGKSN